ncbi:helix-turn-helix domain-containing protein [Siminovitchia sp. FSL H7-0308]|uniref:helix-turn-helix domain-containing protein n=1 Tax=unclassified Siminovitchia TaxID=2837530 RepID=UPI0030D06302
MYVNYLTKESIKLKRQGFKVAAIARKCNLSRTTVYEYLDMDIKEACRWTEELKDT